MHSKPLLALLLCLPAATASAGDTPIKPIKVWEGRMDEVLGKVKIDRVIASQPRLEALWSSWKLKEDVPTVDFTKHLVIAVTAKGSKISVMPAVDAKGDLKVNVLQSADLAEGLGYRVVLIPREGIKTVEGKELK